MKLSILLFLLTQSSLLFSTETQIFMRPSRTQLRKVPENILHKTCELKMNKKDFHLLMRQVPSIGLIDQFKSIVKEKGYSLKFGDDGISYNGYGYKLNHLGNSPRLGDFFFGISVHVAKKGTQISLTEMDTRRILYEGIARRNYCEFWAHLVQSPMQKLETKNNAQMETIFDLRLTEMAKDNEAKACVRSLKTFAKILPPCERTSVDWDLFDL